jgi:MoaA/NifB/PqqE/SkfB family radical SAM enzyme
MKAQHKYRVNMETHVNLGEVAPLAMPYVLVIDPINVCNLRCKFCPTGNPALIRETGRYRGALDFKLFQKIIDSLAEFGEPLRALRLYKEGEPLLNPRFPDMVRYAKDSGLVLRVDTTSNGVPLRPELNRAIVAAGLDQINISVNGVSSEQIEFYTGVKLDFDRYVANIRDLYENRGDCEISIKGIQENLSEPEREKFFDIFGGIADRAILENLSPAWPLFEFHKDVPMVFQSGNYGQAIVPRKVCPYLFYMMVVNASGLVSTCIGDWPNRQIVGDTRAQTVREIWQGEALNRYRLDHLRGLRGSSAFCGACQVVSHGTLDDMDAHAAAILERMGKH